MSENPIFTAPRIFRQLEPEAAPWLAFEAAYLASGMEREGHRWHRANLDDLAPAESGGTRRDHANRSGGLVYLGDNVEEEPPQAVIDRLLLDMARAMVYDILDDYTVDSGWHTFARDTETVTYLDVPTAKTWEGTWHYWARRD